MAVKLEKQPPANLLTCARRPEGLPTDQEGVLTEATRAALIAVAVPFRLNADQIDQLVNFLKPGTCPTP